jgi:hypothetical protein
MNKRACYNADSNAVEAAHGSQIASTAAEKLV